jgi:hypothetical protein
MDQTIQPEMLSSCCHHVVMPKQYVVIVVLPTIDAPECQLPNGATQLALATGIAKV